ncbi:MAG TPA: hypothetical protein VHP81_04545, partial [Lachnospiraceae bacterium]|nr:hypothetical protein [Lachnospiraceae bacterium]
MRYLIGMELKRLFKSMKNLFVLTLFLLTLLILAFYNDKRDGEYEADRETIYNQSLSADFTTITMISMDYIDTLSEEEAKNFNHVYPADVT